MKVGEARAAATEWVMERAAKEPWFQGAYFSGSTIAQADGEEMSPSSDIDVIVVTAHDEAPPKPGKFIYREALVEATYLTWSELAGAEEVLANYHLAGSFRVDAVIADPTGRLRELQAQVSRRFADQVWVERRCEQVVRKIENGLTSLDPSAPLPQRTMAWLFPTGVTTHLLLVAALRNPTVRLRYLAARRVLDEYRRGDVYPELLKLLGCLHWTPECVGHHLDELAATFDAAAAVAKTPFPYRSDIASSSRPVAIDGSRALIRAGLHREAVFWIAATFARCHAILAADAPELHRRRLPAFEALNADLGVGSPDDMLRRAGDVLRYLPRLQQTARAILAANPDIRTGGRS